MLQLNMRLSLHNMTENLQQHCTCIHSYVEQQAWWKMQTKVIVM